MGREIETAAVRYVNEAKTSRFDSTPPSPHETWSR
jgi:hypothetical protein